MKFILVQVSCNNIKEAKLIGESCLAKRLVACYEIYPRLATVYFWPPKKNRLTRGKGCLLSLISLPNYAQKLKKLIQLKHSDKVPYIACFTGNDLNKNYYQWLCAELK